MVSNRPLMSPSRKEVVVVVRFRWSGLWGWAVGHSGWRGFPVVLVAVAPVGSLGPEAFSLGREWLALGRERLPLEREWLPLERERLPLERERLPLEREWLPLERELLPLEREWFPPTSQRAILAQFGTVPRRR